MYSLIEEQIGVRVALPLNEMATALLVGLILLWRRAKALFGEVLEVEVLHDPIVELEPAALSATLLDVGVVVARVCAARVHEDADEPVQEFILFLARQVFLLLSLLCVLLAEFFGLRLWLLCAFRVGFAAES